jgi:hypothetical protein
MPRNVLVVIGLALAGVSLSACGNGVGNTHSTSPASPQASGALAGATVASGVTSSGAHYLKTDEDDDDNPGGGDEENDDPQIRDYGHPAAGGDASAITVLVKRYYAAALNEDGAAACSLLTSRLRRDPALTRSIPEDRFDRTPVPKVSRGEGCAQILSRLFKEHHGSLVSEGSTLQITGARVEGAHGLALLGFGSVGERWMPVAREDGAWKMGAVLGHYIP